MHYVPILDNVFLAFGRELSCRSHGTFAAVLDKVFILYDFRSYEASFEV